MNDKPLQILIRKTLLDCLAHAGITDLPVVAGNQPLTQGRLERGVYIWHMGDTPRGFQGRKLKTNPATLQLETVEHQFVQTQFQVNVFSPDNPASETELTAKDICELVRMLVQSLRFVENMTLNGVGVQMPSPVRNPFFVNDQDQFEANPSFDFVVSHKRITNQQTHEATVSMAIHRI